MSWLSIFKERLIGLWPFGLVLGLCAVTFVTGEQYPLSRFPMYDKFPDHTYYVYVADSEGNPIPVHTITGVKPSKLKKPYDKEINGIRKKLKKRKIELTAAERQPAGEAELKKLYMVAPDEGKRRLEELAPIQLMHVWIFSEKGKSVEREAEKIATFSPDPAPAPTGQP